jgi:DNA repair exonuclease SbcCD ATPase subunit
MQLHKVEISGFRSFRQPVTFQLARAPGLVLITGCNEVDRELGANGVGKTGLFDAVTFALFGQTGNGERGPKLVSDGSKGPTVVVVDGEVRSIQFRITRQQSPNRLILKASAAERIVTQEDITTFLGITYEEFLRGCYHVQGSIGFVGLKPQGMLDEFSSYLNLNAYDAAQSAANSRWTIADHKKRSAEGIIATASKILEDLRSQHEALSQQAHVEARAKLIEARANAAARAAARAALQAAQARLASWAVGEPGQRREAALGAARRLVRQAEKSRLAKERAVQRLEHEWDALERLLTETVCPTCGQPWDRSTQALTKRKQLRPKLRQSYRDRNEADTMLVVAKDDCQTIEERNQKYSERSIDKIARVETEIQHQRAEIERTTKQAKSIAQRVNAALNALIAVERTLRNTEEQVAQANTDLAAASAEAAGYGYWRKGFKLLKLWVISRTVAQFQAVADDNLASLGMTNWRSTIDADPALDRGKLKIQLVHRSGAIRTPAELSFGENQRVKIALDLAVGDVCLATRGITANVEFWDEPMTWLSTTGIAMFLAMLERRASTLGKTIYLSDHRTLDHDWLDVITVVKTKEGSDFQMAQPQMRLMR